MKLSIMMTEYEIKKKKKKKKKISARLHTQIKASKMHNNQLIQVIRASIETTITGGKTRRKKVGKQDEFYREIKILYLGWFNLIKYHLSGKIYIRVIIRNKILKLQKYTSTITHGEQTNLEVDKKSRNYGNIHQLQPLQPRRSGLFMVRETLDTGNVIVLYIM